MRKAIRLAVLLLLGLGMLAGPAETALAQGLEPPVVTPAPPRPPLPPPPPRLPIVLPVPEVKYQRVEVSIDGQVATTRIDQLFVNNGPVPVEGVYLFPLPEDAAVSSFTMYVDGQRWQGELLPREKARQVYESIVRRQRDPALLEYIGRGAFQARVFPIPPRGERRIQLDYAQVLPAEAGVVRYVYPLKSPRILPREAFEPGPAPCLECPPRPVPVQRPFLIKELTIHVALRAGQPIKAIYSPSHEVAVTRPSDRQADVSYEAANVRPDRDFDLYYSFAPGDIGLSLLTYRERGQDGFFLLLIAPPVEAPAEAVAKDVVFVLDISGSMQGEKLGQAKAALEFVLERLNPGDRFNIVVFNSAVRSYADSLRPASERALALPFVRSVQAAGGTNIHDALQAALGMAQGGRPHVVIFLTDGLATVGVTDTRAIVDGAARASGKDLRLFTFGIGDEVNAFLLDTIAQRHRGASDYIRPGQSIQEKVARFYEKVSTPVLTDLRLDMGPARVEDIYPQPLPDLFAGNQLVVVGRYRGEGAGTVGLHGLVNGRERSFTYPDQRLPAESTSAGFLPRLWATRKVGYLLNQVRLHGENKELVDEIVGLATRYAIATPYTSFLVQEQEPRGIGAPPGTPRPLPFPGPMAPSSPGMPVPMPPPVPQAGAAAVQASQAIEGLRRAQVAADVARERAQAAGGKVFLLQDGVWTDTAYQPAMPVRDVSFGSEGYFRLLDRHPEAGRYLAVGERVLVVLGGTAYRVTADAGGGPQATATPGPGPMPAPGVTPSPAVTPGPAPDPTAPAAPAPTSPSERPSPPAPRPGPSDLVAVVLGWLSNLLRSVFG